MTTARRRFSAMYLVVGLGAAQAGASPGSAWGQEAAGMAVSVVAVRRHCFHDRVTASGTFKPRQDVEVRAGRDGLLVSEVFVEEGDSVTADQVLARLVSPQGAPQDGMAVKAPVSGVVVAIAAPIGSYTSTRASSALFRIVSDAGLELDAAILTSQIGRLKVGLPAKVHVIGLGDLDGRVSSVGTSIDATSQSGSVFLSVPDSRLRIGAFARADIDAGTECGVIIPLSALLSGPQGDVVGVVQRERVEMRPVTIGILEAGNAEVRTGLQENEQVIARAGAFLREGDRVRAVPAPGSGQN